MLEEVQQRQVHQVHQVLEQKVVNQVLLDLQVQLVHQEKVEQMV